MFNPERLLGHMIKGGVRRHARGIGGAALGMGLFGVALAAVDHLKERKSAPPPTPARPPAPPASSSPPPLPTATPPPPPPAADHDRGEGDALLLVRAMIAAAAADGAIDARERQRIVGQLTASGASDEERAFVERELASPPSLDAVVARVDRPELGEQVYAASLLAIDVDTEAEKSYLSSLAAKLGLAPETLARLHRDLGLD